MGETGIEWTEETWNPIRGCRRTAPAGSTQSGCGDATGGGCYAEAQAGRIVRMGKGKPTAYDGLVRIVGGKPRWTGGVSFDAERLAAPLRWRRGRRVFVNSMSDLFYEKFTNEQIAAVFGVMAACPQHTFQILTKRARRMREWFEWVASTGFDPGHVLSLALGDLADQDRNSDSRFSDDEWLVGLCNVVNGRSSWSHHDDDNPLDGSRPRWPLPNAWIGVSVENQAAADERITELLRTPAAVRFLSCEPLLSALDLSHRAQNRALVGATARRIFRENGGRDEAAISAHLRLPPSIDWVIAGCESGPGARPCDVAWLRSLRDQCEVAGVAFFLKQARETESGRCGDADNPNGDRPCGQRIKAYAISPDTASYSCGCCVEGPEDGACVPLGAGEGSHRKPGGIIGAPYLDGVQHLAFPEHRRG